jgi:hypothetical protein
MIAKSSPAITSTSLMFTLLTSGPNRHGRAGYRTGEYLANAVLRPAIPQKMISNHSPATSRLRTRTVPR